MAQRIRRSHLQLIVLVGQIPVCLYGKVCLGYFQCVIAAVGHHQLKGGIGSGIALHLLQLGYDFQHPVAGADGALHRGIAAAAGQQTAASYNYSGKCGIFQERAAGKFPSHIRSSFRTHQYRFCHKALPIQ